MLHLESPKRYANPVDYISKQMIYDCLSFCFRKNPEAETDLGEPFFANTDEFEDNADEKNRTQITINPHEVSLIETMEGDSALDNSSTNISFGTFTRGLETRPHENVPDHELTDIQKLEKHCPTATDAERQRFLNAKGGKYDLALEQLKHYLNWREEYDLDVLIESKTVPSDDDFESCASSDETLDEIDWKYASDKALSYDTSHPHYLPSALPQLAKILTCPGSDEHLRDKTGNRILYLLPAQMDPNMAQDSTFALCIAFYLERKLDRNSLEQMIVAIDVRAGAGWANPRPGKLIPFIKKVTSIMERNFPERLSKCILFPMPRVAAVVWKMVRAFLDPNTAAKITVLAGAALTHSPPPYKKMEEQLDLEVIERMEAIRLATFTD